MGEFLAITGFEGEDADGRSCDGISQLLDRDCSQQVSFVIIVNVEMNNAFFPLSRMPQKM